MRTAFLAGGIASGKSTVSRLLRERGAWVLDLDQVSREVLAPGEPLLEEIAAEFGSDVIDASSGELSRALLAERAFATPEATERLERLELPAIRERLVQALTPSCCAATLPALTLVEVPLLDRVEDLFGLADDILVVVAPMELRRARAIGRGMAGDDFDTRVSKQPSEAYLLGHATHVFDNSGDEDGLRAQVDAWWAGRVATKGD